MKFLFFLAILASILTAANSFSADFTYLRNLGCEALLSRAIEKRVMNNHGIKAHEVFIGTSADLKSILERAGLDVTHFEKEKEALKLFFLGTKVFDSHKRISKRLAEFMEEDPEIVIFLIKSKIQDSTPAILTFNDFFSKQEFLKEQLINSQEDPRNYFGLQELGLPKVVVGQTVGKDASYELGLSFFLAAVTLVDADYVENWIHDNEKQQKKKRPTNRLFQKYVKPSDLGSWMDPILFETLIKIHVAGTLAYVQGVTGILTKVSVGEINKDEAVKDINDIVAKNENGKLKLREITREMEGVDWDTSQKDAWASLIEEDPAAQGIAAELGINEGNIFDEGFNVLFKLKQ